MSAAKRTVAGFTDTDALRPPGVRLPGVGASVYGSRKPGPARESYTAAVRSSTALFDHDILGFQRRRGAKRP